MLSLLQTRDVEFDVIEYLKSPPDRAALERILELLPDAPANLVRKDKTWKELGLDAADYVEAGPVVDLLLAHPKLMQRPILVVGDRAAIGRPPEQALALL